MHLLKVSGINEMKIKQVAVLAMTAGLVTACAVAPKGNFVTAPSTPAPEGKAGVWLSSQESAIGDAVYNLYLTPNGQYAVCGDYLGETIQGSSGKLTMNNDKLSTIHSSGYMSEVSFIGNTMAIKDFMTFSKADHPTANCYKFFKDRGMIE